MSDKRIQGIFRGIERNYFEVEVPGGQLYHIRPQEVAPELRGDALKEGQLITLEYRVSTFAGLWYIIA